MKNNHSLVIGLIEDEIKRYQRRIEKANSLIETHFIPLIEKYHGVDEVREKDLISKMDDERELIEACYGRIEMLTDSMNILIHSSKNSTPED